MSRHFDRRQGSRTAALVILAVCLVAPAIRAQTAACCNPVEGICQNLVSCDGCGAEYGCYPGITCAQLNPPCQPTTGACCDRLSGACYDWWYAVPCQPPYRQRFIGSYCWEVDCPLARTIYVDANASDPAEDGATWCSAFRSLSEALAVAEGGDIVRVAEGTYKPDPTGLADPREATFNMKSGVAIYGGYAGCGAADPDQRSILGLPSVLSGDFSGDDALPDVSTIDENTYHVVTARLTDTTAVLDGFIITGGASTRAPDHIFGGGLLALSADPYIARCIFYANLAIGGGGIAAAGSSPILEGCVIVGNLADYGAGLRALGGPHHVQVRGCTFYANSANVAGAGAAASTDQHVSLMRTILWANMVDGISNEQTQIALFSEATVGFEYSCVEGWTGSFGGVGNLGDDPLFTDIDGLDDIVGTLDDNLRLQPASPCLNSGDPSVLFDPTKIDLDDHARVLCGRVDMGAFEAMIGDSNCDGAVDLGDFAALQACFTSAGGAYAGGCEALDFDADGDVDLGDFSAFFELLTSA